MDGKKTNGGFSLIQFLGFVSTGEKMRNSQTHVVRISEVWIVLFGFALSLLWEALQSPFYLDTFQAPWSTVIYNRLHCSVGDVLILLVAFWITALFLGRQWIEMAQWGSVLSFVALGLSYTAFSEYLNVYVRRSWEYSRWMPTIMGFGIVPLILVPAMMMGVMKRFEIVGPKITYDKERTMKKTMIVEAAFILALVLGLGGSALAQQAQGEKMMGQEAQKSPHTGTMGMPGQGGAGMGGQMGPGMDMAAADRMRPQGEKAPDTEGKGTPRQGEFEMGGQQMGQGWQGYPGMGMGGPSGPWMWSPTGPGMGMMGSLMGSPQMTGMMMSLRGDMMTLTGQMVQRYGGDRSRDAWQKMHKEMVEQMGEIMIKHGNLLKESAKTLGR